jgi:glycine betaine transporter
VTLGGLALVLVFSGGLKALQTASIIGALPFVLVIYFLLISLIRELIAEKYASNR